MDKTKKVGSKVNKDSSMINSSKKKNLVGSGNKYEYLSDGFTELLTDFKNHKNMELEAVFPSIGTKEFEKIVGGLSEIYEDNVTETLDIIFKSNKESYRVTIKNNIDKFIELTRKYTNPFDMFKYLKNNKNNDMEVVVKDFSQRKKLDNTEYPYYFKLLPEKKVEFSEIPIGKVQSVYYRHKTRVSFDTKKGCIFDCTEVSQSKYLSKIFGSGRGSEKFYEMEMEIIDKNVDISFVNESIHRILDYIKNIGLIIGNTEKNSVIEHYMKLLRLTGSQKKLAGRNVVSIRKSHIVDHIPNRYAVTDKADGERMFLITMNNNIYFINNNLRVYKTGKSISKKEMNNTILDGEYISNDFGEMYLAFDIVYHDSIDYRTNDDHNLVSRLEVLNKIINDCFENLIPFNEYISEQTLDNIDPEKIRSHNIKELEKYWNRFKKELKKSDGLFVTRKLYFMPYGIGKFEVFMYADILWRTCTTKNLTPYDLDGIIYTPVNLPYMISSSQNNDGPMEYKWKDEKHNSIDFYIEFEEGYYKDENVESELSEPYVIAKLFVGLKQKNREIPIPFMIDRIEQKALVPTVDGNPVDMEGEQIMDRTVVEFYYDQKAASIDKKRGWIPMRTRFDKTDSVKKYGRMFGNNINVAKNIWESITDPVTADSITALSKPDSYEMEMKLFRNGVKETIPYYQKTQATAVGMRAFHNFIKSNLIMAYAHNRKSVLDIGCGRGGDLHKFVDAGIKKYVGLDVDYAGLFTIPDSAIKRSREIKNRITDAPQMDFIHADARGIFNPESQKKILGVMKDTNAKLIQEHLTKKYDFVNCQFSIHYYLSDELSWMNFCENLNNVMDENSYFVATCFDGDKLFNLFKDRKEITSYYTDNHGEKNLFFKIIRLYEDTVQKKTGVAIDLYNSMISEENIMIKEYLVFSDFLISSLKKYCGLELVEQDSFYNLYKLYQRYFIDGSECGTIDGGKITKRHNEIRKWYASLHPDYNEKFTTEDIEMNTCSFKLSILNKYYVFRKTGKGTRDQSRIVGVNNKIFLGKILTPHFSSNNYMIDAYMGYPRVRSLYEDITKKILRFKPAVYIIKHSVKSDGDNFRNTYKMHEATKKSNVPMVLVYKSPEKTYYPIYRMIDNKRKYSINDSELLNYMKKLIDIQNDNM